MSHHKEVMLSTGHVILALQRFCTYVNATAPESTGLGLFCDMYAPVEVVQIIDPDTVLPPEYTTGLAMIAIDVPTMLSVLMNGNYVTMEIGRVVLCLRRDSELAGLGYLLQNSSPQYPVKFPIKPQYAVNWLLQVAG